MADQDVDERGELSSAADVRLERLLEDLQRTTVSLAISIRTLQRSPANPVFRASVDHQFRLGIDHLAAILRSDAVVHADRVARTAIDSIEPFVAVAEQVRSPSTGQALRDVFQSATDDLFSSARIGREGRPAASLEGFLGRHSVVPKAAETAAPETDGAAAAVETVLFEQVFSHGGPEQGPKRFLGDLYLSVLVHLRGLQPDEARKRLHAQALIGFNQSLERSLGTYRGPVAFQVVSGPEGVRVVLKRLAPVRREA